VTVVQALDRGAPRIDAAFLDQPELRTELLGVTGEIYRALGPYDRAEAMLPRSLDVGTVVPAVCDPQQHFALQLPPGT
jgi:hypothetical protein